MTEHKAEHEAGSPCTAVHSGRRAVSPQNTFRSLTKPGGGVMLSHSITASLVNTLDVDVAAGDHQSSHATRIRDLIIEILCAA